jgi:hypothetical protein
MPTRINQRTATPEELAILDGLISKAPTAANRLTRGAANALVLWAATLLALLAAWLTLGWLAGKVFAVDLGLRSSATLWVLGMAAPACAVFAIVSSAGWVRNRTDHRRLLQQDLSSNQVAEEHYVFTDARRFQEPEHGGLLYFLRSAENEVFTVHDHESQDLGVDNRDPLQSSYRPQSHLRVVRAPRSGFVLGSQSSGTVLNAGAPVELCLAPEDWPEAQTLCNIPWSQLEARLGSPVAASTARRSDA